jgi:hypothetical protein
MVAIDLALTSTLDLHVVLPSLKRIGIRSAQLFADDMKVSQEIGRLVTWFGYDRLFVPSARSAGRNLVIDPGRAGESYTFEAADKKALWGVATADVVVALERRLVAAVLALN